MTESNLEGEEASPLRPFPALNVNAMRRVQRWRINAVGNRPRDHRQRDLLHGSLLRDYRLPMLRRLSRNPPDWVQEMASHLPPRWQPLARQNILLQYIHQRHLLQLEEAFFPGDEELDLIGKLAACRPIGADWRLRDGSRAPTPCRKHWLCLWCHARMVSQLHRRLAEGPCRPEAIGGRRIFRVDLPVPGYFLGSFPAVGGALTRDEIHRIRGKFLKELLQIVRRLGCTSGLWSHQIGPSRTFAPEIEQQTCFVHSLSIVGEIDLTDRDRRLEFERIGCPGGYPALWEWGIEGAFAVWYLFPRGSRDPLRIPLFGTAFHFDPERAGIQPGWLGEFRGGLNGAFFCQPRCLLHVWYWQSLCEATRGLRSWSCFGRWRQGDARPKRRRPLLSTTGRLASGPVRRRRAFSRANNARRRMTLERRSGLLEAARPTYERLLRERGRRPGRPALREALSQSGLDVSERDAKWLIGRLAQ